MLCKGMFVRLGLIYSTVLIAENYGRKKNNKKKKKKKKKNPLLSNIYIIFYSVYETK